jgi:hypothetical protein
MGEIPEGVPGAMKSGVGVERSVKNVGGPRGSGRGGREDCGRRRGYGS